jgi:hypothetical protein
VLDHVPIGNWTYILEANDTTDKTMTATVTIEERDRGAIQGWNAPD